MFFNTKSEESKQALQRARNFKKELYGNDRKKGDIAIGIIDDILNVQTTELQRNYLSEVFSRMDIVTLTHSLEATAIADKFISMYESNTGKSFEKEFNITSNDFKLALLIHDTGKIVMNKELILSNKLFTAEERQQMKNHSLTSIETIKQINDIANPETTVSEVFSSKVTDIAQYHHPEYIESIYERKALPAYAKLASMIDVAEAMSSENRYYKEPSEISEIVGALNRNLDNCCSERQKATLSYVIEEDSNKNFSTCSRLLESAKENRTEITNDFTVTLQTESILAKKFNEELLRHQSLINKVDELDNELLNSKDIEL